VSKKQTVNQILKNAIWSGIQSTNFAVSLKNLPPLKIQIEKTKSKNNGDYATNIALKLSKLLKKNPMQVATEISTSIQSKNIIRKIEVAKPGFINFFLNEKWLLKNIYTILKEKNKFGNSDLGENSKIQIEFVSVNPTGPIHIGHARGAVLGSVLANILEVSGYDVSKEYYINDAGNQIEKFYQSVFVRYLQNKNISANMPEDGYEGKYILEIAQQISKILDEKEIPVNEKSAQSLIGETALKLMITNIKNDLESLKVFYDNWFSEKSLINDGIFSETLSLLDYKKLTKTKDGAKWFTSTKLGDTKDKVLIRSNGTPTYFGTDVAYHYSKIVKRNFDQIIDIWGADHQGHVPFMKSMMSALDIEQKRLKILLYQLVTIKKGSTAIRLSKRKGEIVTLKDLIDEVGVDACRYFFISKSPESQMEFDLDYAKNESKENPVYYIQYAHARICSILEIAKQNNINFEDCDISLLSHESEIDLIQKMIQLPDLIENMASNLTPHHLPHYTLDLANNFHVFYQNCKVISENKSELEISKARLKLISATKIVLSKCLQIMGMNAPKYM
tara:strand:- start:30393 stop:32075 length:1683 start_codon:yes stop_codon:yes gene_type:complete